MSNARWQDLLDEHAQALATGDEARRRRARLLAQDNPEVLALMDTAEQARAAIRPVAPRPEFRARLKATLAERTGQRRAYRTLFLRTLRSYWLWGALASVLSLAGGVGYYLHRRSQAGSIT